MKPHDGRSPHNSPSVRRRALTRQIISIKIPLPEIGREDVVHIHMYRAHDGTRGLPGS